MSIYSDQVNEKLGISIDLFFIDLDNLEDFENLQEIDKVIICTSLLGKSRREITAITKITNPRVRVQDKLGRIYNGIANLTSLNRQGIADNWTLILNWLLDPAQKYRLNPGIQLNADSFQASFGRQVFLYPFDRKIGTAQTTGAKYYQSRSFYLAQECFLFAWQTGKNLFNSSSPEILIYINNCVIELNCAKLERQGIAIHTIAAVVPIHHDRGQIAAETLQGIAQIQFQINAQILELSMNKLALTAKMPQRLAIPNFVLKILIVNDINNLHDGPDRTAENLVNLSSKLNLIAVIGNYSSEATSRALPVYSEASIVLVNSSSTSIKLSTLDIGERLCFFRIPPMDTINAASLIKFLSVPANFPHLPKQKRVAIIYAQESAYSQSYLTVVENELSNNSENFKLSSTFGYSRIDHLNLGLSDYVIKISRDKIDVVILIIDTRIEPNFLANTGILSYLDLSHCVLAGSATLYQQKFSRDILAYQPKIISCLPWHFDSYSNGCESNNSLANDFCVLAESLWGNERVTWRSATAYDSVLLIARILQQFPNVNEPKMLLEHMNEYLKNKNNQFKGVTGELSFKQNGDRHHPPTEIVQLCWNESIRNWEWKCAVT